MFLKQIVAVFMALAIANPACCCALKGHSQNGSENSSSCCAPSPNSGKDSKEQDKPCGCSFAKEKATPEHEAILPDLIPSQPLPPVFAKNDCDHLPKLSQATAFLKKWPPGSLPTPSTATRLAAKCSYLF